MDKKTKTTIFFIEGQEHVRFVEPYISIVYNIGYEIKIISLENLNFRNHIFNDLVDITATADTDSCDVEVFVGSA